MVRRVGGGRRSINGLWSALMAEAQRMDAHWHVAVDCGACEWLDTLNSGEPVQVEAEKVWRVLWDERHPRDFDEFLRDGGWYVVTGDRIEAI